MTKKRKDEAKLMLQYHLSIFTINVFIAVLLWLFAIVIYIPITRTTFNLEWNLTSLVGSIFLVAITIPLIRILKNVIPLVDVISDVIAQRKENHYERRYFLFKQTGYILTTLFAGLFISKILEWIHPLFSGIVLIISIILIFYYAFIAINVALK